MFMFMSVLFIPQNVAITIFIEFFLISTFDTRIKFEIYEARISFSISVPVGEHGDINSIGEYNYLYEKSCFFHV